MQPTSKITEFQRELFFDGNLDNYYLIIISGTIVADYPKHVIAIPEVKPLYVGFDLGKKHKICKWAVNERNNNEPLTALCTMPRGQSSGHRALAHLLAALAIATPKQAKEPTFVTTTLTMEYTKEYIINEYKKLKEHLGDSPSSEFFIPNQDCTKGILTRYLGVILISNLWVNVATPRKYFWNQNRT
jgi:hypothetical protein